MTDAAALGGVPPRTSAKGFRSGPDWRNGLFIAPFLLVYVGLLVYPLFWGMWISLLTYDMFDKSAVFSGLDNFRNLFSDTIFLRRRAQHFRLRAADGSDLCRHWPRPGPGAQPRGPGRRRAARGFLRRVGAVRHDRHHHLEDHVLARTRPDFGRSRPVRNCADFIPDDFEIWRCRRSPPPRSGGSSACR